MTFPINYGLLDVYGAALPAGMKEDMMSQVGQRFLNQPQAQPAQATQPAQSPMQNPMQGQMQQPQAMQNDPVQQQMAAMQEQQNQANAYKMMGQGIQNYARGMQQPMPSGNTAQIIRDQGGPRMQGNQQQQMAQMLRRR